MKDIALESPPPMVSMLRFFSAITDDSKKITRLPENS
jgi:hypothetical protein